jgi:hypothetical protein
MANDPINISPNEEHQKQLAQNRTSGLLGAIARLENDNERAETLIGALEAAYNEMKERAETAEVELAELQKAAGKKPAAKKG